MNRHAHASRAFSLVELLVVISIVALLVAMLLPALGKARQNAQRLLCANNMRQVAVGYASYATDNKDWLPVNNITYGGALNSTYSIFFLKTSLVDVLEPSYGLTKAVWNCPVSIAPPPSTVWSAPYVDGGGSSLAVTPFSIWAGRTAGYWGDYNANAVLPSECPQKMSDRIMFKGGNTVMPWFNDHAFYAGGSYNQFLTSAAFIPYDTADLFHFREGVNSAQPDASVTFKKFQGIVADPLGDSNVLKFMGPVPQAGFPAYWGY